MKQTLILGCLLLVAWVASAAPKTYLDLPMSGVTNTAYLTSMSERPWWNKAWTRRAPILVSNCADEAIEKAVVDIVVNFGEEVKPEDVRVVTPWETEVECVAERVRRTDTPVRSDKDGPSSSVNGQECPFSGTNGQECPFSGTNGQECPFSGRIRLLFQTSLRVRENKPFLVYWNRRTDTPVRSDAGEVGTDKSVRSPMQLSLSDSEVRLGNGLLDITFDNRHKTPGLIRKFRVVGSRSADELLERATGYAWRGFVVRVGGNPKWGPAQVVLDMPLKKTIRFESEKVDLDFTLAAEQSRLDYTYRIKSGDIQCNLGLAWACGGGCAYDDLIYPGSSGEPLKVLASLDHCTDCIPYPSYDLSNWIGEGWYAIRDRRSGNVVGQIFDRPSLSEFHFTGAGQYAGESVSLCFRHERAPAGSLVASGALYAGIGSALDVRREARCLAAPPQVFVGAAESVREIPYRVPRLDRDYSADFNIGKGPGPGWDSGEPLEGTDWAENIVDRLLSYGANVVRVGGYRWCDLPVSKELYDKLAKLQHDPAVARQPNRQMPEWKEGAFTGAKFREHCKVAHAKGMAVATWTAFLDGLDGIYPKYDARFDRTAQEVNLELQRLYVDCGADIAYNGIGAEESPVMPEALRKERGDAYWKWKDPRDFFRIQQERLDYNRRFYRYMKAAHPDVPVALMPSEDGELRREMWLSDLAGSLDVCYNEMLPVFDDPPLLAHVKHVAKRMRALYDNEPHTVYNHYFFWDANYAHRIHQLEVPFICGVNGFSHENLTYENFDREACQLVADFHRFNQYTGLGAKVAKMTPVKDLAVFRDARAYEEDIVAGRLRKPYPYQAQQDGRVNSFAEIRNLSYDVVINPFFTAKSLAKYRVVYIPEDEALTKELAEEALKYVENGGGLIVEGATCQGGDALATKNGVSNRQGEDALATKNGDTCGKGVLALAGLGLKNGEVKSYGKGKILWLKECLTDRVAKRDRKAWAEMRAYLASVGGVEPFTVTDLNGQECPFSGLDGVLQASGEGQFLGVYNWNAKTETGKVHIGERTLLSVPGATRTDKSVRSPTYVLDVKRGIRLPLTNNTFTVSVGPRQCGYYLIGGDKFTALPKATPAVWCGWSARAVKPNGAPVKAAADASFRPAEAIEVSVFSRGKPPYVRRADSAKVSVTKVDAADIDERTFAKVLKTATYVHFLPESLGKRGAAADQLFASQAEAFKAFLVRGGGLLFDRSSVGPEARKFLASVGVFDPTEGAKTGVGDGYGRWSPSVSTNHALYASCHVGMGPEAEIGGVGFGRAYPKWDAKAQTAPVRAAQDDTCAVLVVQENVLGKGKVVFSENRYAFNDFYENTAYGDNILSWLIGCSVKEHAQKVVEKNGGPGEKLRD